MNLLPWKKFYLNRSYKKSENNLLFSKFVIYLNGMQEINGKEAECFIYDDEGNFSNQRKQ